MCILVQLLVGCNSSVVVSFADKDASEGLASETSFESNGDEAINCEDPEVNLVVSPAYSAAPLWNDYIENNEDTFYSAVDGVSALGVGLPCNDDDTVDGGVRNGETTYRSNTCIHAGEIRRVVTEKSSCDGLTARDSLAVFDWTCTVEASKATFYSKLKPSKGLKDLLDSTAFKVNKVEVVEDSCVIYESAESSSWFTNTIRSLDGLTPPISLGATGIVGVTAVTNSDTTSGGTGVVDTIKVEGENIIFTLSKDLTIEGFNLSRKSSLVVLENNEITFQSSGNNNCNSFARIGSTDQCAIGINDEYAWFEGNVNLNNQAGDAAIAISGEFQMLRNITARNPHNTVDIRRYGIYMYRAHRTKLFNIKVYDEAPDTNSNGMMTYQCNTNYYYNIELSYLDNAFGVQSDMIHDLRKVTIHNIDDETFNFSAGGFANSTLHEVRIYNVANDGIYWNSGGANILHDIVIFNTGATGMSFNNAQSNTVFSKIFIGNSTGEGFNFFRSDNSSVQHTTIVASGSDGFKVEDSADNNSFSSILTVANGGNGIRIDESDMNLISQIATGHNANYGLYIDNSTTNMAFTGDFLFGQNQGVNNCFVDTNASNTFDVGNTNCTTASGSLFPQLVDMSSTFAGKVLTDQTNVDYLASSVTGGDILYDNITDFNNFDYLLRSFGVSNDSSQVSAANSGSCVSPNTCSGWDWRLSASDTEMLNINGVFQEDSTCPNSVHGDIVMTITNTQGLNTYLVNAYEILDDDIGDDDALCESNEACIFTPNIGYYQGEGELVNCVFDDGTVGAGGTTSVIDVNMYGFSENGAN